MRLSLGLLVKKKKACSNRAFTSGFSSDFFRSRSWSGSSRVPSESINSVRHPLIVLARELRTAEGRRERGKFLVEGSDQVLAGFAAKYPYSAVLTPDNTFCVDKLNELSPAIKKCHVSPGVFDKIFSSGKKPEIIAVADMPDNKISEFKLDNEILVLDNLQDPGNIGTIIRTAHAFGIKNLFFLDMDIAEVYSRNTIRSSMGSIFSVKLAAGSFLDLNAFCNNEGFSLVATSPMGSERLETLSSFNKVALVFGNEAVGISEDVKKRADALIKIAMKIEAESINVGVAAGVVLYERMKSSLRF